jgi:membrane protease YdiL (CAAX protease family)
VIVCIGAAVLAASSSSGMWRSLLLVCVAPLVEEAAFRAGLHEWLIRSGVRAAGCIGLTAAAFAGVHLVVRQDMFAAWTFAPAVLLGLLYQRTRSVSACVAAHALMNATWIAFAGFRQHT